MLTNDQVIAEVRDFVRQFPTPNTRRALALCESGRLAWSDVHELFRKSLAAGLAATR